MKVFLRWELDVFLNLLPPTGKQHAINFLPTIAALMATGLDIKVNEVRRTMGFQDHPDTLTNLDPSRGDAFIHVVDIAVAGDDEIPAWYKNLHPEINFP